MNVSVLLTVALVIVVLAVFGAAGIGQYAAHDQALKRNAPTHLHRFVRYFLGVYTRGS